MNPALAHLIPPQAFEVSAITDLKQEIFGPVLHIVRWGSGALSDPQAVIDQINALGYGLTIGIQTRIDSRAQALARAAHVGNVYINRNQIGAVVGVQPFGGEGLSGTGPKAGGPYYLYPNHHGEHHGGRRECGVVGEWALRSTIRRIQPVQHGQCLVHITRGRHGTEMVLRVPCRQRVRAEQLHQLVHGQTPALRYRRTQRVHGC